MLLHRRGITGMLRFFLCLLIAVWVIQLDFGNFCRAKSNHSFAGIEDFIVEKIDIEILSVAEKDVPGWKKIARNLIFLKEGEPFSDIRFSQTVSALNRSGLFETIDIPDPDWSEAPVVMNFYLKPFARIKKINISGGFPMLQREIEDFMTIYTGDAYIPEKIDKQEEYIKEVYKEDGYIDPEVSLSAKQDPADGHYIVYVTIEKGAYYEITRVRTRGNDHYSGKRLLPRTRTWQSSMLIGGATRFVTEKLEEDRQRLLQFYRGKGFCEARIDADVKFNEEKKRARITFNIDEGPRYDVSITGNDAFWTRTLIRELVIYEEGNINDFGLRKSIRNIESRYREKGYPDARVNLVEDFSENDGQQREIELAIDEGRRYIVENVLIHGNENISTDTIKEQMLTAPPGFLFAGHFVFETRREDVAAIRSLYRQKGYLSPVITSDIQTRVSEKEEEDILLVNVDIDIREGPRTIITGIAFENLNVIDEQDARKALSVSEESAFRNHRIQESRTALATKISERGYPHVRIDTESVMSADETESGLTFHVDEGPYVEMGESFFTGNFLTRRKTLSRQLRLERNEPFMLSEMLASQRNIRNINALETASFRTIGLEEKADRVTLICEVNEKKPYFLQFATGYDTSRLFYVNTGLGTINLLGRNKELRTFLEWSMIGYKGEIGYTEPNLFNTGIVADANVFTEKTEELNKNFGVKSTGASVNFSRLLTPEISASLGFLYDHRDQYRTDDKPIAPEDEEQYRSRTMLVTTPGITYNTTDSFVRPTRGIRASASVGISWGIDNDLDDFFKYRATTRYYYTPSRRLTLALMGQGGYIDPYGSQDTIPDDQLFFLGGTMNVRGFSENRLRVDENRDPVGGRTYLMGSAEARYNIGRNFELATFYDTGTIRNAQVGEGLDEWRSSAGLGLRYHTAIGPIGLMHGWKIDRKEGESPGAWHFSIGYTF